MNREKTQIKAIRLFRVYTSSENGGVQREASVFRIPSFFSASAQRRIQGRIPIASGSEFAERIRWVCNDGTRLNSTVGTRE